jgi:hypothetical protein
MSELETFISTVESVYRGQGNEIIKDYIDTVFKKVAKSDLAKIHGDNSGKISVLLSEKEAPKALLVKEKNFTGAYDLYKTADGDWINLHTQQKVDVTKVAHILIKDACFVYSIDIDKSAKSNPTLAKLAESKDDIKLICGFAPEASRPTQKGQEAIYEYYYFLGYLRKCDVVTLELPISNRGEFPITLMIFSST